MTSNTAPNPTVSVSALFELLAHRHRRYTLYHLDAMDGETIELSALLEALCERDVASRDRLETQLHHAHLPKLDEQNLIDYDAQSELIHYRGSDRLKTVVEFARRKELDP